MVIYRGIWWGIEVPSVIYMGVCYVERYMVRCRPKGSWCWMVMYEVVWCCIEVYGGG